MWALSVLISKVESGEPAWQVLSGPNLVGCLKDLKSSIENSMTPWGKEFLLTDTREMKSQTKDEDQPGQLANFLQAAGPVQDLADEHKRLMAMYSASKKYGASKKAS